MVRARAKNEKKKLIPYSPRKHQSDTRRNRLAQKNMFISSRKVLRLFRIIPSISSKTSHFDMAWRSTRYFDINAWAVDRYHSLWNSYPCVSKWSLLPLRRHRLGLRRTIWYLDFITKHWWERAFVKAERLIRGGCVFSEFGSRRRRDYHTHDLVIQGLVGASKQLDGPGKFSGTSNVHFAMKHGLMPIGTVAHEVQTFARTGLMAVVHGYRCYHAGLPTRKFSRPQTLERNIFWFAW